MAVLADAERVVAGANLGQYDIALVDLGLPGMSGLDLVWEIWRHHLSLPIRILTRAAISKAGTRG